MRPFLRPSRHVILTVVLLAVLAAVPFAGPAQAADQSLVLESLQVLQTHYVDPVGAAKVLNAGVAGLRQHLSAAGIAVDMPEIPSSATEPDARRQFGDRFITAAAAASGQLTKTELAYAAIRSMTDSFHDSHPGFLTPEQNAERRQRQRGQAGFTGVGIVLLPKDERFYVWTVIPGGPAEAVGVHEFDRIMKVNDVSTGGLTVDQVAGMIRGPAGTPVTVTFQRPGVTDPLVVTMTRAPIVVPSIFKSELLDGGVGYIRLYQFVDGTGRDVRNAMTRLLAGGMRVLVLDLRGNSGGFPPGTCNRLYTPPPARGAAHTAVLQGGGGAGGRATPTPLPQAATPVR